MGDFLFWISPFVFHFSFANSKHIIYGWISMNCKLWMTLLETTLWQWFVNRMECADTVSSEHWCEVLFLSSVYCCDIMRYWNRCMEIQTQNIMWSPIIIIFGKNVDKYWIWSRTLQATQYSDFEELFRHLKFDTQSFVYVRQSIKDR